MSTTIRTNNQWRYLVYRTDVPAKVLAAQFDYQDSEEAIDGFFQYRGQWYHLDGFMRLDGANGDLAGWHAYAADSYFSGVVIRLSRDGESVMCGTYYS